MPDINENELELDRGDEFEPSSLAEAGKDAPAEKDTPASKGEEGKDDEPEVKDKLSEDGDEEGTETDEERAEREKEEEEAKKKRNIRIPKYRFDEAQVRAKKRQEALLAEIEQLKGSQKQSDAQKEINDKRAEIAALQDKYEDLIMDGRKDEARAVRKKVEAMRDELLEYQTSTKSDAARRAAIEELSYNAALASVESDHPELNPDNSAFDQDKVDEVAELLNAMVKSGVKRATALSRAVKYVMGSPAKREEDSAKASAEERARKAREKAAQANKNQPANTSKAGKDSDKGGRQAPSGGDVMRMSQEAFAKLEEDELAKLRGDEL